MLRHSDSLWCRPGHAPLEAGQAELLAPNGQLWPRGYRVWGPGTGHIRGQGPDHFRQRQWGGASSLIISVLGSQLLQMMPSWCDIWWWWELTPGCQETENSVVTNASVDRKRRIASIFQHYYPEGGWGLVLLLVVLLVQVILHGLLLSYGVLLSKVARRFRVSVVESGQDHFVSITHIKYLHAQLFGRW